MIAIEILALVTTVWAACTGTGSYLDQLRRRREEKKSHRLREAVRQIYGIEATKWSRIGRIGGFASTDGRYTLQPHLLRYHFASLVLFLLWTDGSGGTDMTVSQMKDFIIQMSRR